MPVSYTHLEGSFRYDNFPVEKESDDVYTLKAVVADLAGNETEKSLTFSVNRFGSVYTFTPSLAEIDGRFFDKEQDIVIHETNVDTLDPETIDIKVARNGQNADMEDVSYQISNNSANGSWSQYSYRLTADNFSEEGVYVVSVNSVDAVYYTHLGGEDFENAEMAQVYRDIGRFNEDITMEIEEASDAGKYAPYFQSLQQLTAQMEADPDDAEIVMLEVYSCLLYTSICRR